MPTLSLEFPARRYHATPWGHHVNEGLVEWPPSPWRILRALLSSGYTRCGWPADGLPGIARGLMMKLAGVLPSYRLPDSSAAHTRHFMPLGVLEGGAQKTTLVFDTWAQIDRGTIDVHWATHLTAAESSVLAELATRLSYLGRSESWVVARISPDRPDRFDAYPCGPHERRAEGWEQISLLAPIEPESYAMWRRSAVQSEIEALGIDPVQLQLKAADKKRLGTIESSFPVDSLACLQVRTNWLTDLGWSQPPGTRSALYWRRMGALDLAPPARKSAPNARPVEAMLLALASESRNDHALPPIERTLLQAEDIHRIVVSLASTDAPPPNVITGCDDIGRPLDGSHAHVHTLPLDLDGDGHIDHVLIWAPMGLDGPSQAAIRRMRRTFLRGSVGRLSIAVAAAGRLDDLRHLRPPFGTAADAVVGSATEWQSITPFVAPRYLKKSGRNTLEGQVSAECASRGLPAPDEIQLLDVREYPAFLRLRRFNRRRRNGPPPPIDAGFALRLRFARPVRGPLALGYASHFGLGLFGRVASLTELQEPR